MQRRCIWAVNASPPMMEYHDTEWGVPLHDDTALFGFLVLEGAQAGLSWETILNKRENYRKAFDGFDPVRISQYTDEDVERLLADPGIVRNRLKVVATIENARRCLQVREDFGSFDGYIWQFVCGNPIKNRFTSLAEIPARTKHSDAMSKDLKRRGFKFVGSTICYAFMQAVGMVNDHEVNCFRYNTL
ncbi:MAG: DNA-3-methyladenine glycosylase I [Dehalococcoidia bacterium]